MRSLLAITRVTVGQLLLARRTFLLGALVLLPAVVMYVASSTMTESRAFQFFHEGPIAVLVLAASPLVALVLSTSALGEERRQGTISFLAVRPIPRWGIIAAKGAATWAASFALVGGGGLLMAVALGLRAGMWDTVGPIVALAAINTLGYVALFMPLGYFFKRAILFGIAYVFVWESGISAVPGLSPLSVFRVGLSAYVGLLPETARYLEEPIGSVAPGMGGAVAKAVVLALAGGAVLLAYFRRRDLV